MNRKDSLDAFGVISLVAFSVLLGFNQVIIKVVNEGLQPVFFAGLRSLGATICIGIWLMVRGRSLVPPRDTIGPGVLMGSLFAAEFILLFTALDMTTVVRASIMLYTMPVWFAIAAHFLLPGERITRVKLFGLALAFAGVVIAISDRSDSGNASLIGDLMSLGGAFGWAGMTLCVRMTKLKEVKPDMQLFWQVAVSTPLLMFAALFFGPFIRDLQPIHIAGLGFQIVVVVTAGFMFWLWLLTIYPAATVAAFSFLAPVFGVLLGALLLGESAGPLILAALVLVAVGLYLINKPQKRDQVPQNV